MPDVRTIPSQITRLALIYITGLALAVLGFGVLAFGKDVSISLGIDTVAVFPPMFLVLYLLLQKINNDLRAVIERALNGKSDEDDDRFIAGYPLKLVLCMIFIDLFSGIAMEVVSRVRGGVILGGVQIVFLITISTCLLAVTVSLLFYKVRIMLYSLGNRINYKPLNMFQKLAIPILSAILILLSLASVGIYRMTYGQVYSMRSTIIAVSVNKNMQFIDGYFGTTLGELKAHSMNPDVRSMRADRLQSVLRELRDTKDTSKIEMFLIADERGDTFTDMGGQSTNIAEREYYKKVMAEGRYIFSEPIVSKATQKEVVVCAVPVSRNGKITGVIAATILADTIDELFAKDTVSETGRFMLISRDGRFIFHKNRTLVGKDIIKDFPDDGKNFINTKNLIQSGEGILFSYRFFGKDVFSYKVKVPVLDYYLVFSIDKNDFLKEINLVVIEIIAAFLVLSLITFFIIYRLAMNFSKPISNMTKVIKKLAEGDLTTENDDFLADEFGELIRNFKLFQARLREIIQRAMDAVVQLSTSAEELAATSSTLSEGAQSQAASVEEASASLEEVSGAVELINTNAGEQACLARDTFSSMEKLKKDNETVVGYAAEALKAAKNTTGQANTGQSLMENTIAGMNSIDESTKKIAETVRLISDISDQVNLLALNASIEAARAGEHGKGFAVVAEEISKLADETASSAKTINDLVKTGLGEVGRGREYVDATGAALKNIIGYISHTEELVRNITESAESQARSSHVVLGDTRKVMEMAESISSSTNEQMMTNQEMSKTVEQINQNTQSSAAAAEQIASSAEEISAQAESLRQQMEFFRVG